MSDDLAADAARLLSLGATRRDHPAEGVQPLDPDGRPFSVRLG